LAVATAAVFAIAASVAPASAFAQSTDPLPSWNDGPRKAAIIEFVSAVTNWVGSDFVPVPERIATFDNDGTLWIEQPIYTQVQFALDRVRELAPDHPEWETTQPFQAVLEGDQEALLASGKKGLVQIIAATHAGMTTDEFEEIASAWIASAHHPRFDRVYTELVYQPMLELLEYLRSARFKVYIVSGGGVEFMRPWTERVYRIPPEQVIGSSIVTTFEWRGGEPVLVRQPEIFFVDDKEGKPIGIQKFIGRRPIASFGNADADIPMLQWTLAGDGARLAMIVHHTDDEREYAYDRDSHIGKLSRGLDEASAGGWLLIDMKNDWGKVFAW
jgi:phosphoglycolate phosphatase-like HAD superfamily hydrolase